MTRGSKRCTKCGGKYDFAFFHLRRGAKGNPILPTAGQLYRDHCIGCETTSESEELITERSLRRKAMGTRHRHGMKLAEQNMIKDPGDLEEVYNWSIDRMIDDIKRVRAEGCSYCELPVDIVGQGLRSITLDIFNPDQEPHYSTNVRWCCGKCNSEKQRISPAVWGARLSMWHQWRRNQERSEVDPEAFGFLRLDNKDSLFPTLFD